MRCWAAAVSALMLVAGCSQTVGGQSQPTKLTPMSSLPSRSSSSTTTPAPTAAPNPGAPIADVIAWIAAGEPADVAGFHTATRDGTATDLGDDVAFTTPSGKTTCATMSSYSSELMCLVQLKNPPPRPTGMEIHWPEVGGFRRCVAVSGSFHGDPGPFANGDGPQLPYGKTLKFSDYQCRTDQVGLYCVNYAHQSFP